MNLFWLQNARPPLAPPTPPSAKTKPALPGVPPVKNVTSNAQFKTLRNVRNGGTSGVPQLRRSGSSEVCFLHVPRASLVRRLNSAVVSHDLHDGRLQQKEVAFTLKSILKLRTPTPTLQKSIRRLPTPNSTVLRNIYDTLDTCRKNSLQMRLPNETR